VVLGNTQVVDLNIVGLVSADCNDILVSFNGFEQLVIEFQQNGQHISSFNISFKRFITAAPAPDAIAEITAVDCVKWSYIIPQIRFWAQRKDMKRTEVNRRALLMAKCPAGG
jgi:hypothetical protein